MTRIKSVLFLIILVFQILPVFQLHYSIVPEAPLKGYFTQAPLPEMKYFTWTRWFSQDFQQLLTTRLNENTGFRNTLIRVRNQYDYSCFGFTHAEGFLEGKERCLFEEDYIHEYTGGYFIGEKVIDKKLARLKNVVDTLAAYDIPLILVFEPGKASFYPENIPGKFHPERKTLSNYDYFVTRSAEIGLSYLDLNRYFLEMKDTARFPLFPKYGMHWSLYGAHLAADSLSRYIGRIAGRPMAEFAISHLQHSGVAKGTDYDIGDLLNLVFPLKSFPNVYPEVAFNAMPVGKLAALVVADSYYINLVETYGEKMFSRQDYWYYNSSIYPHQNDSPPLRVDKTGLQDKLKSYNVILLMVSEINLHCCFWGFADEAWQAFHPEEKDSQLEQIENTIRIDREWFRFMVKKSGEQKKPLEQVIRGDAEYAFLSRYESLPEKGYQDSIQYLLLSIRYNPGWLKAVTRKAWALHVPLDTMLVREAVYSYAQSKKKQ